MNIAFPIPKTSGHRSTLISLPSWFSIGLYGIGTWMGDSDVLAMNEGFSCPVQHPPGWCKDASCSFRSMIHLNYEHMFQEFENLDVGQPWSVYTRSYTLDRQYPFVFFPDMYNVQVGILS